MQSGNLGLTTARHVPKSLNTSAVIFMNRWNNFSHQLKDRLNFTVPGRLIKGLGSSAQTRINAGCFFLKVYFFPSILSTVFLRRASLTYRHVRCGPSPSSVCSEAATEHLQPHRLNSSQLPDFLNWSMNEPINVAMTSARSTLVLNIYRYVQTVFLTKR